MAWISPAEMSSKSMVQPMSTRSAASSTDSRIRSWVHTVTFSVQGLGAVPGPVASGHPRRGTSRWVLVVAMVASRLVGSDHLCRRPLTEP
jgi:hypothetical protein